MSSLWTDLLFLHGHISDPQLARRLTTATPPPSPPTGEPAHTHVSLAALSALYTRICQGIGDGCVRRQ